MSPKKKSNLRRHTGQRPYRKLFVIAAEGEKTELEYFDIFKVLNPNISVKYAKEPRGSAPLQVLKRMEHYLNRQRVIPPYEAWLVVDKDSWLEAQLKQLHTWAQQHDNYGFALSNPKFEYWLLLHFEAGAGIKSPKDLENRLEQYLSEDHKGINAGQFTQEKIETAICHARKREGESYGTTTVHRLVENMLAAGADAASSPPF